MDFILGSSSPRRRALITQYGIKFRTINPDVEEIPKKGETAKDFVRRVARLKLRNILKRYKTKEDTVVLTADTIVVLDKKILGKPINKEDAFNMLKGLQGRWHTVYTAYCIFYRGKIRERIVKTDVQFRTLTKDEILTYIKSGEPMDKAGAYAAQGRGANIIKKVRGSYTNVIGLPMAEVIEDLKRLKIQPKF